MINEERISARQMAFLIYPALVADAILILPGTTGQAAGRDLWLSPIWGSLTGLFVIYIVLKLNRYYPKATIFQYGERLLGRVGGKIVSAFLLLTLIQTNAQILRSYADFIAGTFLEIMPITVILGVMAFVVTTAVHSGIEVLGRLSELFLPFTIVIWIFVILFTVPDWDVRLLLPVMEGGIWPSLKGAATPHLWFLNYILLAILLPFVAKGEAKVRWSLLSWTFVIITMVITNLVALFMFGETVGDYTFPFMEVVRYIKASKYIEHIDALLYVIWVAGTFIQIAVFQYVVVLGTAQWLNVPNYRPLSFPLAFILVLMSQISASNLMTLDYYIQTSFNVFSTAVFILTLLLLWVAAAIKHHREQTNPQQQESNRAK